MLTRKQFRTWPENAFPDRRHHPVDPTRDWVPSPPTQPLDLPLLPEGAPIGEQDHAQDGQEKEKDGDPPSRLSLRYWRDRLRARKRRARAAPGAQPEQPPPLPLPRATTADWRAYGHWARPAIDDMVLHNATPPTVPRTLAPAQVEAILHNLVDWDGTQHPERWIAGVAHPCLPPRPALWPPPDASAPPPPARALQLNPLLAHRAAGPAALQWDLRATAGTGAGDEPHVELGDAPFDAGAGARTLPVPVLLELHGPNGAQPATCPGVRALRVTALADDPLPVFPWPFVVRARHAALPVDVRDVLCAIRDNLEQHMARDEVAALALARQAIVFDACLARCAMRRAAVEDGVQRVDYLGPNYMFRGLEPAPDGEGFMMFVGPP